MKTETAKKGIKINKTGWMPFIIISGGLVLFIVLLKWLLTLLG